eukprot:12927353-Prorocentrum_lima.AAC.1
MGLPHQPGTAPGHRHARASLGLHSAQTTPQSNVCFPKSCSSTAATYVAARWKSYEQQALPTSSS